MGAVDGEVTELADDGIVVATSDGQILVTRVRPSTGQKIPAIEFAKSVSLSVGTILG